MKDETRRSKDNAQEALQAQVSLVLANMPFDLSEKYREIILCLGMGRTWAATQELTNSSPDTLRRVKNLYPDLIAQITANKDLVNAELARQEINTIIEVVKNGLADIKRKNGKEMTPHEILALTNSMQALVRVIEKLDPPDPPSPEQATYQPPVGPPPDIMGPIDADNATPPSNPPK